MTIPEAIEAMRRNVGTLNEAGAMLVLADVWEEYEANVGCGCRSWSDIPGHGCYGCHGTGSVSNGNSLRAEALRLLAECGKVGHRSFGYGIADRATDHDLQARVCIGWFHAADGRPMANGDVLDCRILLMDAYAAADPATRERWARETRALVPGVDCEACKGTGLTYVYMGHGDHDQQDCWPCNGTGRIPASQEARR